MSTNDGGPAFPQSSTVQTRCYGNVQETHFNVTGGMTLRDYFAAKAMQGMLVGCVGTIGNHQEVSAYAKGHCNSAVADRAYAIADAMLAAREAK